MAKSGFWLRGAKGKLAGASIGKSAFGGTVIRQIVKPKNPKSEGQMIQRIILATVAQAYSRMKGVCDHAFQGLGEGAYSQARFNKINLRYLRGLVTGAVAAEDSYADVKAFIPLGQRYLAPNRYIISEGSLPAVNFAVNDDAEASMAFTGTTYGDFIQQYGLQRGDQLTFMFITGRYEDVIDGTNVYAGGTYTTAQYCRIILDPRKADGSEAALTTPLLDDGEINLPNPSNQNTDLFQWQKVENTLTITQADMEIQAFGIIVSRNNGDGSFSYSPCQMDVCPVKQEVGGNLSIWSMWTLQDALDASTASGIYASDLYLRQAEKKK